MGLKYLVAEMSQFENGASRVKIEIRRRKVDVSVLASSRATATRPWSTFKASCEGNWSRAGLQEP